MRANTEQVNNLDRSPFDEGSSAARRRFQILSHWGTDSVAYSTTQDGLDYFDYLDGYIAYNRVGSICVALPPVSSQACRRDLLAAFVKAIPKTVFFYISKDCAQELLALTGGGGRNFFVSGIGTETVIECGKTDLGKSPQIPSAARKAKSKAFHIEEAVFSHPARRRRISRRLL
jgi:hypothetical protein